MVSGKNCLRDTSKPCPEPIFSNFLTISVKSLHNPQLLSKGTCYMYIAQRGALFYGINITE